MRIPSTRSTGRMWCAGAVRPLPGALLTVALVACSPQNPPAAETAPTAAANGSGDFAAHPLPGTPDRFGFGSPASEERIARWDIDIKPDGEGLPPGSGSVAAGRTLYELSCVQCHGPSGTEGPNDPLVATADWDDWPANRAIGSYWPWATTIFDYTRRAMPQLEPGSLTDSETYAVVAYILHLNGLLAADAVLDATALAAIEMPARDRFVPDDRTGGARIRE